MWLAVAVLLIVLALAARAEAAPDDALALAKRYADILTGVDQQAAAPLLDDDEEDIDDADDLDVPAPRDADIDTDDDLDDASRGFGAGDDVRDAAAGTADLDVRALDDGDALDEIAGDDHPLAGELATLDLATVYPDPTELADQSAAFQTAGGAELYDAWVRHRRPSRFGRLDLDVSWRSYTSDPRTAPHYHADELWLIATWRQ